MYPIDNDILAKFKANKKQYIRITLDSGEVITEEDIVENGLSVNRYSVSGDMIELGSVISAELTLSLDNTDGTFDEVTFLGNEMFVEIGVMGSNDEVAYVPLGYFTADEAPRKLQQINLTALDRMMKFEKEISETSLVFPYTVAELYDRICTVCGVQSETSSSSLLNANFVIQKYPEGGYTYRNLLSFIGEITCTCSFIDWQGKLVSKWYSNTSTTIGLSDRYTSDIYEDPLTITGVQVSDGEDIYVAGTDGYVLTVADNPLIQSNWQTIADSLNTVLSGFTYTPFSATTQPMPHIYPLDIVTFVTKDNASVTCIISDWTFYSNCRNTNMAGRGMSDVQAGYGTSGGLTRQEASMINQLIGNNKNVLAFYELRNPAAHVIRNGSKQRILHLKLASNTNTRVQIHINANLATTDTNSDGFTTVACTYVIDGEEAVIQPYETYIDGSHVLHLMYILPMMANTIRYFNLFMEAGSGTVTIDKGAVWLYASGLGIVGDAKWDGELDLEDATEPILLAEVAFGSGITESVTTRAWRPIKLTLSDNASGVSMNEMTVASNVSERVLFNKLYLSEETWTQANAHTWANVYQNYIWGRIIEEI